MEDPDNKVNITPGGSKNTNVFYHYTNMQALLNIIGPEIVSLRASHYKYLNDRDEIIKGIDIMKDHTTIDESMFKYFFIIALSEAVDNLTMWLNYSDVYNGCILGFKASVLGGNIIHCNYGPEATMRNYESFKNSIDTTPEEDLTSFNTEASPLSSKDYLKRLIQFFAIAGYKDVAFEYEKEVRICYNLREVDKNHIKYRSKKGLIIPYLECRFPKAVLTEIWIPNNESTEMNKYSLQNMLNNYGYYNVEIKVSKTPYRNI